MADRSSARMTERPTYVMLNSIAQANHCQAGAVIGLSGALAAALGQATANGSLEAGVNGDAAGAAREMQRRMSEARAQFQALADQDATAIGEFVALRESGHALKGYGLLCDGPRDMAKLAIACATLMQDYRRHVCERTRDDLEFAITLMAGVARSAMQLLDSNLRIWPLPELLAKYGQIVGELTERLDALKPLKRIRQ
jgi:hypothetical protein